MRGRNGKRNLPVRSEAAAAPRDRRDRRPERALMFVREIRGRPRAGFSGSEHHHGAVFLIGTPGGDALPVRVSGAKERLDKTVVLVSHRQSTMRIADRIYSVENGRMS